MIISLILFLLAQQATSLQLLPTINCYEWVEDTNNPGMQKRQDQRKCFGTNTCITVVKANGELYGSCVVALSNECADLKGYYPKHLYAQCCRSGDRCNVEPSPLPKPGSTTERQKTTKRVWNGKVDISGISRGSSVNGRSKLSDIAFVLYFVLKLII